ncbi:MAG: glycerol kinase GlpK [Pseudomonadota bacterium]|nr:glycerol kinase GlpK [Pseudomonadota bacterium]
MEYILAIDQGTTSSRAILFDKKMDPVAVSQKEFPQYFPNSGWVEHDPEEIWDSVFATCKEVMEKAGVTASDIKGIGITNQRETVVVWNKNTGKSLGNAIVWQDRRTASICEELKKKGLEDTINEKTGLLLDPYFSSSKLSWILDNTDNARDLAESGQLLFGTIDTFILWKLSEGKVHATDATNAARTMLYDIEHSHWSEDLCEIFQIPMNILPAVKDCASSFGETSLFGAKIPILGMAGDQQAATLGQACFEPGMIKATYGTGCFALLNTGSSIVRSKNKMLTTIAYQLGGETTYALEGSIFVAGAAVQWLRDGLKLIESSDQTDNLALGADKNENIIFVPALTGIGAPYWNANCRGAIYGITRNTTEAEIALATLQSAGYQTRDLIGAMSADWKTKEITSLRVDGGMSASNVTMQFMSDIVGIPVERPKILETTALGVAWLAGSYLDIYPDRKEFAKSWSVDKSYFPEMDLKTRDSLYRKWQLAIKSTLNFSDNEVS